MSPKTHKAAGVTPSNVVDGISELLHYTPDCYHISPHPQMNSQAARWWHSVVFNQSVSQSANHPAVAQAARLSGKRVSQSTSEFYNTATRQVSESKRQSAGQGSVGIDGTGTKPVWAPRGGAVVIHLPASLNLNASLAWNWYSTSPYRIAKNILAKCGVLC